MVVIDPVNGKSNTTQKVFKMLEVLMKFKDIYNMLDKKLREESHEAKVLDFLFD